MNARVVTLDLEDVVMAMSDQNAQWMIDLTTGKLCMAPEEAALLFGSGSEEIELWAPTDPEQVLPVPHFDSSDGYQIMQTFALEHAGDEASKRLQDALRLRKPFRRFKDALGEFPDDRRRWFEFEAAKMKQIAEDFFEAEGYAVEWTGLHAGPTGSD